ncbi:unnamed protein product [Owenia fusiformis]|uniref:Uncharacterized protein n=1 Tax=Owenia fusiformis TaxID=6347 RepID=A0A8J1TUI4_OWEFU|nr:unnamed protein product [Owenia fusiformis]
MKLQLILTALVCAEGVFVPAQVKLPEKLMYQSGDLLLGGLLPAHVYDSSNDACSDVLAFNGIGLQHIEAVAYTVDELNSRDDILPNITLGFVILDMCRKDTTALAQALHFAPHTCDDTGDEIPKAVYDVVCVMGPYSSSISTSIAQLLTVFGIPQVSPFSTSDVLSDKSKYKYFMRTSPPDKYLSRTMVDIMSYFNWNYISALNSEGAYGSGGISVVKKLAKQRGICVGYAKEVNSLTTEEEYDDIVQRMRKLKTRVVVIFMSFEYAKKTLLALQRANVTGEFIMMFSDSMNTLGDFSGLEEIGLGAFAPEIKVEDISGSDFAKYYNSLTPQNNTRNPWYPEFWEQQFDCSWNVTQISQGQTACSDFPVTSVKLSSKPSQVMNMVYTIAHGLDALIKDKCDGTRDNKTALRACITGPELWHYMRTASFTEASGTIGFDENGDLLGKYNIKQLQYDPMQGYNLRRVGEFDVTSLSVHLLEAELDWYIKEVVGVPDAVCSYPCGAGEFKIQLELKCCWECRKCRVNEITALNATTCHECPPFHWPNKDTMEFCEAIEPDYINWNEPLAIVLVILATCEIIISIVLVMFYIRHRNQRLIKASNRELSFFILIANILALTTVYVLISKPTDVTCVVSRFLFSISFALAYGPLLTKTNRVWRIFESGKKTKQRPPFISNRAQIVMASILISIQVVITVLTSVLIPSPAEFRMVVPTEKYVELFCNLPLDGFIPPLAYNLVLILLSAIYGFKTRRLPDNFNESKYIFLCVCATLFLWIAFISTYFATFHAYHKVILLSIALIMNATVLMLCLFAPKVYAIYYVDEEKLILASNSATEPGTSSANGQSINAIAPQ